MTPQESYPEPAGQALSHAAATAAQIASLAAAAGEVVAHRKAQRDAQAGAGAGARQEQQRAAAQAARMRWAPAHDQQWLSEAGLIETARTWSDAAAAAGADPEAAAAQRKCEDRLRELHPYGMTRYDQLRDQGMDPFSAMREAAWRFGQAPGTRPRTGYGSTWWRGKQLEAGQDASQSPPSGDGQPHAPGQRAERIAAGLQDAARAAGRDPLTADELATALERRTTLPAKDIARVTGSASRLAALSFPYDAADAAAAARRGRLARPAPAPSRDYARRPGRAM